MKKVGVAVVVVALLFGSVASPQAQNLPGPASGGWFVLIGTPVNSMFEGRAPQTANEHEAVELYKMMHGPCIAVVSPQSRSSENPYYYLTTNGVKVTKRFGPFNDQMTANQQLLKAGWQLRQYAFHAQSGC
jgi:hypothetical protein